MKKDVKPSERRELGRYASERYGLGERQACRVVGLSRTAYRYTPKLPDDSQIKAQLQELSEWKPRWSFGKMRSLAETG